MAARVAAALFGSHITSLVIPTPQSPLTPLPRRKREEPLETVIDRPGLYDLLFTHCNPVPGEVSFTVRAGHGVVARSRRDSPCACASHPVSSPQYSLPSHFPRPPTPPPTAGGDYV